MIPCCGAYHFSREDVDGLHWLVLGAPHLEFLLRRLHSRVCLLRALNELRVVWIQGGTGQESHALTANLTAR